MYIAYWSTQPVREMSTRGISWGLKAALHILMIVLPLLHPSVHSPVGPLSHSLLQWFVHSLYHSFTPLFIIYTFKHSLNSFFTPPLHILLYVVSSLFPATSHSLALSNCSSFSALIPTHSFFYPYWAEICCL